jgi:hypothetical protein
MTYHCLLRLTLSITGLLLARSFFFLLNSPVLVIAIVISELLGKRFVHVVRM